MSEVENLIASTSGEAWVLKNDLCRCCHAEGSFKNMGIPYYFAGETEIYSDMLRECIDINIIPSDGFLKETTFKICDDCIGQLRAASNFRKQVLTCEISFRELCEKNLIRATAPIKIELEIFDEDKVKCEEESDNEGGFGNVGFDLGLSDDDDTKLEDVKIKKETAKKAKGKTKPPPKPKKGAKIKKTAKPKTTVKAETNAENNAETNAETETAKPYRKNPRMTWACKAPEDVPKPWLNDVTKVDDHYRCNFCSVSNEKKEATVFHIWRDHYKKRCKQCPHRFRKEGEFRKHLEEHGIETKIKCSACDKVLISENTYRLHMAQYHKMGKIIKCNHCDYVTYNRCSFAGHMKVHSDERKYSCEFCNKTFKRSSTLKLHLRIHTKEEMKACPYCDQSFVQRTSLKYHVVKHHPGQPI